MSHRIRPLSDQCCSGCYSDAFTRDQTPSLTNLRDLKPIIAFLTYRRLRGLSRTVTDYGFVPAPGVKNQAPGGEPMPALPTVTSNHGRELHRMNVTVYESFIPVTMNWLDQVVSKEAAGLLEEKSPSLRIGIAERLPKFRSSRVPPGWPGDRTQI
eukprot:762924-Hanusia_phi.AAC.7